MYISATMRGDSASRPDAICYGRLYPNRLRCAAANGVTMILRAPHAYPRHSICGPREGVVDLVGPGLGRGVKRTLYIRPPTGVVDYPLTPW